MISDEPNKTVPPPNPAALAGRSAEASPTIVAASSAPLTRNHPIDPATLGRDRERSFDKPSLLPENLPLSEADFIANRSITAPVVLRVAAGDPDALAFYKKHRLFNLAGIPAWARESLDRDAQKAYDQAMNEMPRHLPDSLAADSPPGLSGQ
jgi:hypothetical protein